MRSSGHITESLGGGRPWLGVGGDPQEGRDSQEAAWEAPAWWGALVAALQDSSCKS